MLRAYVIFFVGLGRWMRGFIGGFAETRAVESAFGLEIWTTRVLLRVMPIFREF